MRKRVAGSVSTEVPSRRLPVTGILYNETGPTVGHDLARAVVTGGNGKPAANASSNTRLHESYHVGSPKTSAAAYKDAVSDTAPRNSEPSAAPQSAASFAYWLAFPLPTASSRLLAPICAASRRLATGSAGPSGRNCEPRRDQELVVTNTSRRAPNVDALADCRVNIVPNRRRYRSAASVPSAIRAYVLDRERRASTARSPAGDDPRTAAR